MFSSLKGGAVTIFVGRIIEMLKKFFTVFLGSLTAIWFSILVFIGVVVIAVVTWIGSSKSSVVNRGSILYIELSGEIPDRYTTPTVQDVVLGEKTDAVGFDEIIRALQLAKVDPNIEGVYLNLKGSAMGLAMREELGTAFADFKKSGKWIVAYGDNYTQGDYFTATCADAVYINPSGSLSANGLAISIPFFKNALDKLGVEIQVIKVGTFKSAVEPFILTQMSDSARYQYDVMLGSFWNGYVDGVASNLKVGNDFKNKFSSMASTPMTAFTVPELIDSGLFTAAKYGYEMDLLLKTKVGGQEKPSYVSPRDYLATYPSKEIDRLMGKDNHIAVLYALGDIVDSGSGGIAGDVYAPLIVELADDDNVKGLVLRINSGGGSAFASEQIWASLEYFKSKDKPFVVSMGDVAASGGYYIACGADKIFADPATITGSIGIFGIIPYARELLNDKLGINFSVVETNPNALFPSLDRPLTAGQHAALEKSIHNGYDLFVSRVATGRNLTDAQVRRIAEGRVWAGATAHRLGLVDEMGGLQVAINEVASRVKLSNNDCIDYPANKLTPMEILLSATELRATFETAIRQSAATVLEISPEMVQQANKVLQRIRRMGSVQARMEDIIINN